MENIQYILPEIFISISIMLFLLIGVFKKNSANLIYNLSNISLVVLLALIINLSSLDTIYLFNNSYLIDNLSNYMKIILVGSGIFVMLTGSKYIQVINLNKIGITKADKVIISKGFKSFMLLSSLLFISPKTTLLNSHSIYAAPKITPKLAIIATRIFFSNAPIKIKNSPIKPVVPGSPRAPSVNTIKTIAYLGIMETKPPYLLINLV